MRPPRFARRLLSLALPADSRHDVLQFVDEEFGDRAQAGPMRARLWYWLQTLSFSLRFSVERLRDLRNNISATDLKLALRMLVRYPGLTVVGSLGLAVGIAISAGMFSILHTMSDPSLPFVDGDRIVALQHRDKERNRKERRSIHDLADWKAGAKSVVDIGAYRRFERNLIEPGRTPEALRIAEMSASGFRITGVRPLMGRALQDADERAGAQPVAVVGETFWREKLHGTPDILGRQVQLGDVTYSVVGVMPASYEFPVRDQIWIPWTLDPIKFERGEGPAVAVFGRLAPGVSLDAARAEFAALGRQAAAAHPRTHRHLEPEVVPYTHPFTDMDDPENAMAMHAMRAAVMALLAVVCVNVAILVYARTARRQSEIAVRTALGAGRLRIVTQLFVEALALSGCAAVAGLLFAAFALRALDQNMEVLAGAQMAFWLRFGLTTRVVLYTAGLALVAAVIVGVIPALKATGPRVHANLKSMSAGGGAGMQLGRLWTFLIVAQVALAVALLPPAMYNAWTATAHAIADPGAEAREFVTAELLIDRSAAIGARDASVKEEIDRRFARRHADLMQKLRGEPGVAAATFSLSHPGAEGMMFIELEGVAPPVKRGDYSLDEGSAMGYLSRFTRIDPGYFDTYGVEQLSGRRLTGADTAAAASSVVVSRTFAEQYYAGQPLGRRFRYVGRGGDADPGYVDLGRWYEIVGVVEDYPGADNNDASMRTRIYHAAAPGTLLPAVLSIKVPGGAPDGFGERLRTVTAEVDPSLQVRRVSTLAQTLMAEQGLWRLIAAILGGVTLAVVGLSAAGIYAMMSFTVAQRRREIGIRSALGADPRQVLTGIFARAAVQLAIGAVAGMLLTLLMENSTGGDLIGGQSIVVLPMVAAFMTMVGLGAAYGPARQGLRIHPTEALRSE